MKTLLEKISLGVEIEFDEETQQYTVINDYTPGIFGLGETKEEAINEYLYCLGDLILVNNSTKYETKAIA